MPGLARDGNRGDTGGMRRVDDGIPELPFKLRQPRLLDVILGAVCWTLTGALLLSLANGGLTVFSVESDWPIVILLMLLLFVGILSTLGAIRPGVLEIREDGVFERVLFRSRFLPWGDIDNFRMFSVRGVDLVAFDWTQDGKPVRNLNTALNTPSGQFAGTFGTNAESLVWLLRNLRETHTR